MVMRGGGRSREIQSLQAKAAQAGGEGTARQAQRLEYLRNHPQAGRRPQGPQTGGPLQQAMGAAGRGLAGAAAGGDELRFKQPWTGGASNGGTTWDGQAPMNPYGGGRTMQPGSDPGFPGGGGMSLNDYQQRFQDNRPQDVRAGEALASGIRPPSGPQEQAQLDAYNAYKANSGQQAQPMQRPTPGNMPGQPPPMQRPTPGQMNDPGFQKQIPPGALSRYQPGPNYFQGEGMGADRFAKFGSPPPVQQPVQGDWFRGGGMDNSRFARPGTQPAFQPPVQGNQIRGGGFGPRTQRVNKNRGSQPAGVLAPIPR